MEFVIQDAKQQIEPIGLKFNIFFKQKFKVDRKATRYAPVFHKTFKFIERKQHFRWYTYYILKTVRLFI